MITIYIIYFVDYTGSEIDMEANDLSPDRQEAPPAVEVADSFDGNDAHYNTVTSVMSIGSLARDNVNCEACALEVEHKQEIIQ